MRTFPHKPRGYTVIEFMMALLILAVLVAIAMPSVQRGVKTQDLNDATLEVMNLVDYARVQAQSRNRAYELRLVGASSGAGIVTLNESANSRCDGFASGLKKVREVDFKNDADFAGLEIVAASPSGLGANAFGLCFKPDGRVIQTDTMQPVASTSPDYAAGEAWLDLRLTDWADKGAGMVHRIVIPYNGVPRREHHK